MSIIGGFGVNDYQSLSASSARRSQRTEDVKTASLEATSSIRTLSDNERAEGIKYLDSSCRCIDHSKIRKYSQDFFEIFKLSKDDKKIEDATKVRENDNDEAKQLKGEYKELYTEIKKDLSYAKMLVAKLGPGKHELTKIDGKKVGDVNIVKNHNGDITVNVNNADGSKLSVKYNEKEPGKCTIDKSDKHGNRQQLTKDGTTCSREKNGVKETYGVGDDKSVTAEQQGPEEDSRKKTVVNKDGSTDTYDLIYNDENGEPVFEHTHKPGKGGDKTDDKAGKEYLDESSGAAIEELNKSNPSGKIDGSQMEKLILSATGDADGNAAGKEYDDLKNFAVQNWKRLDKSAKAVWNVYENCVRTCRARGMDGIPADMYDKVKRDMAAAKGDARGQQGTNPPAETSPESSEERGAGDSGRAEESERTRRGEESSQTREGKETEYKDAGSGAAIEALKKSNPDGKIDGAQIEKLIIAATNDADGNAAGKEYEDLLSFVESNWERLDDKAKAKWNIYENYARTARASGEEGIKSEDYKKMLAEMKAVDKAGDGKAPKTDR